MCGTILRSRVGDSHTKIHLSLLHYNFQPKIRKDNHMSDITCTAKWIADEDYFIDGDLMATKDDILRVHGKHASNGEFVLRGDRSNFFFWAKPEQIELLSELPNHLKTNP